jgi:hypothetical protein
MLATNIRKRDLTTNDNNLFLKPLVLIFGMGPKFFWGWF